MSDQIPPPLIPDPPPQPGAQNTLFLPFLLADAPRLQLDFLSRHQAIPQAHRDAIRSWLRGYNMRLMKWLHDAYGPEAVRAADALSRQAGRKINETHQAAQRQAERDLFTHLEKEMLDDDD